MTYEDVCAEVAKVKFPDYEFRVVDHGNYYLLVAEYDEPDTVSLLVTRQETRYWYIASAQPIDSVAFTCFKLVMTSMEHKTREWFTYDSKPIFQPHHSLDKLLSITEPRTEPTV